MSLILLNSLIVGIMISLTTGPVGCLIVWNRLTYLGDCIAHASMLGIVVSLLLGVNVFWGGAIITIILLAFFINYRSEIYPLETVIAIFSYLALSVALVLYSMSDNIYMNLESFLFGDILAVDGSDIIALSIYMCCLIIWFKKRWAGLLLSIINKDLALSKGINSHRLTLELIICVAGFVIVAIKAVGILLTTTMLVIPAVSARIISRSPESMACIASVISTVSVVCGIWLSFAFDIPSGPSAVIINGMCFLILKSIPRLNIK